MADPTYGVSSCYLGQNGEEYFAWQGRFGTVDGEINAHKFRHLICPTDTVLDFGCGGGGLLRALECSRRIGVEINPVARQRTLGLGIECYADLADVPDGVADVVISHHVLEHIPYPIEALRQLRCKLKRGGTLALCVPIDDWRVHKRYCPDDRDHHLHTWTTQLLGSSLCEAGFLVGARDIAVVTRAWPRYHRFLYARLGPASFNVLCTIWAALARRRQLFAVAKRA